MQLPRRLAGLAAAGSAMVLILSACGGDEGGDAPEGGGTGNLEDCYTDNPNDCNSGDREQGGDMVWLVNQGHDGVYNDVRTEGNSVYLREFLTGLYEDAGEYDPAGEWVWNMNILASEPQKTSEDPLTVTYELRPDAVWSDGTPMSVDDFILNWYFLSGNPDHCTECQPADTTFYAPIESIEGSGQTVTVTWEPGWTHPEWFTASHWRMPAHVATEQGFDWQNDPDEAAAASEWFLNNVPTVSNGPYIVDEWIADERQTMVPNPQWQGEPKATLASVTKVVISDQPTWPTAMQNDEIDAGAPASFTSDVRDRLSQLEGVLVGEGAGGISWDHFDFNMDAVQDVALRQAIFTAVNREDAVSRIYGDSPPPLRNNMVFPERSDFYEDFVGPTGYGGGDVEAARTILTDAGYTGAEEGGTLTDPDGNPVPDLRVRWLEGNQNRQQLVQLTQSYLAQIGVTVTPEPIPPDDLGTVLTEGDFDLVVFGWIGSLAFASSPNQFYHSESPSNYGRYNNPTVDDLVLDVPNYPTQEESAEIANQAVPLILEDAFTLPLWDTPNLIFVRDSFVNVRDNLSFQERAFYNSEFWGVRPAAG